MPSCDDKTTVSNFWFSPSINSKKYARFYVIFCANDLTENVMNYEIERHWADAQWAPISSSVGEITSPPGELKKPFEWKVSKRILVNPEIDLFDESVPENVVDAIFASMAIVDHHSYLIATRHPARMREYLIELPDRPLEIAASALLNIDEPSISNLDATRVLAKTAFGPGGLDHIWPGAIVENQEQANERVPQLMDVPGYIRWLWMEPLTGPVSIDHAMYGPDSKRGLSCFGFTDGFGEEAFIQWVVVGGGLGGGDQPMHPNWIEHIKDQCEDANVPFTFSHWGEWAPRSACYHRLTTGLSASDMDPQSKRWSCVRLTFNGGDGWSLEDHDEGDDVYMQKVGPDLAGCMFYGSLEHQLPVHRSELESAS
jgi:protein gp37